MAYRRNYSKRGLRKRWYLNAGMNLPFLGKTNIKMGNQKFKRAVKSIVRRSVASPQLDVFSTTTNSMTHSTIYTYNVTAQVTTGNAQNTRLADTIHLKYLKAKLRTLVDFSTLPTNVLNAQWRVMVLKSSKEYNPSTTAFGSGLGSSEIFLTSSQPEISYIDSREVKVLYDKTFVFTTEASTDTGIKVFHNEITIPLNQQFKYRDAFGDYGKYTNLYMVVIPHCAAGVTGTTIIGSQNVEGILGFSNTQ